MRLPGALSRLAAPFFSTQAKPFSRRRSISDLTAVSVWRFGETSQFPESMHGVIVSVRLAHSFFPSLTTDRWRAASYLWLQVSSQNSSEAAFVDIRVTLLRYWCVIGHGLSKPFLWSWQSLNMKIALSKNMSLIEKLRKQSVPTGLFFFTIVIVPLQVYFLLSLITEGAISSLSTSKPQIFFPDNIVTALVYFILPIVYCIIVSLRFFHPKRLVSPLFARAMCGEPNYLLNTQPIITAEG